jgi:hypothetical protein
MKIGFSLQLLFETFLILRRIQRDIVKNVKSLHVKYTLFLPEFNETWIFLTDFRKKLKYQISSKSVQWEPEFYHSARKTDGRRDMMLSLFEIFANAHRSG